MSLAQGPVLSSFITTDDKSEDISGDEEAAPNVNGATDKQPLLRTNESPRGRQLARKVTSSGDIVFSRSAE
jgi:hypothetical protein